MAFCKIQFMGNVGRDPEVRYTPNGRPVASFSAAVSYSHKDQQTGEWIDEGTDWFNVTVWGDRGEAIAEKVRKGDKVFVDGRFKTRAFDKKSGGQGLSLDVTADTVIVIGSKGERAASSEEHEPASAPAGGGSSDSDELPF